jgi:hypothetical protein
MAAGLNFKFTTTAGEVIDLTDPDVNKEAAPESTPRQGGFTIRNRWNCSNLTAAAKQTFGPFSASVTASATSANIIKVLRVPDRTLVQGPIHVMAVEGETIPGHVTAGAATAASLNSAGAAGVLGFTAYAYNDTSRTAASIKRHIATTINGNTVLAGAALGGIPIQKFDAATEGAFETGLVEAVDTSMTAPWLGRVNAAVNAASTKFQPGVQLYFPFGGFITMTLGPNATALGAMASSKGASQAKGLYGSLSGVWEVQADCMYVPE